MRRTWLHLRVQGLVQICKHPLAYVRKERRWPEVACRPIVIYRSHSKSCSFLL